MYLLIVTIISFILIYNIYTYIYLLKVNKIERKIEYIYKQRSNLIPSFYLITKDYINKHDEVFAEILKLRKFQFFCNEKDFITNIQQDLKINDEITFIFTLLSNNYKINKNWKYLYLRDLFLKYSWQINEVSKQYKSIIKKYNNLLKFKNLTIIWFFLNFEEKFEL